MYPPHHPKVIQYLMQLGHFNLLESLFNKLSAWIDRKGTMAELYNEVGLEFFQNFESNS